MARSARIVKVDRRGQRCTLVKWRGLGANAGEASEIEVPGGMPEFRDWIRGQLADSGETLVALALANWLATHPNEAADFSGVEGKTITLDLSASATVGIVTVV